jgi:hypothetical protein
MRAPASDPEEETPGAPLVEWQSLSPGTRLHRAYAQLEAYSPVFRFYLWIFIDCRDALTSSPV